MAVDSFARLTSARYADLASTAPGKGASLIALPFGGSLGDLGGNFRDAVFATATTKVEIAHALALATGKARLVINGINWVADGSLTTFTIPVEFVGGATCSANGFALNFTRGFRADDYAAIFSPRDAPNITLPRWQRLTPFHFGAKADYVSAASPGTDDGDALNAWASELCTRVMPAGRYGTTKTIHWNGGAGGNANANCGIQCDPQATIYQRTDNIPIMTAWGSRGQWDFPVLEYANRQAATSFSAVGLLICPYPGQTGWYQNVISRILVRGGANVGVFNPPAISSTTTVSYAQGDSALTVANAQTDAMGAYPWVPGMWVQVALASSGWHISRIASVAGAVLTLATPLPGAVNSGAAVVFAGLTPTSNFPSAMFSNTIHSIIVDEPSRYGLIDRGTGTGDAIANLYVRAAGTGDATSPLYTIERAVVLSGKAATSIAQLNVEYLGFNQDVISLGGRHFKLGEVHIEGCRSFGNNTGLISGTAPDIDIDLVQVEYWTAFTADIATAVGIFYPRAVPLTELGSGRGQWRIRQLNTRKNLFNRADVLGRAFVGAFPTATLTQIRIESWRYDRDGGMYPSGQLTSPSNKGGLVSIGNLLPPDCVGFAFDVDASSDNAATYQRIFTSPKGQFKVREILAFRPTQSLTTATCGIFADNTGTTLISSVSTQALSTLTDSGKVLSIPLVAGEATTLRAGSSDMFFKINATQAKPAAVTGTSSYLTGRNGGDNNTNLGFINFAAAHGLNVGDYVLISGSVSSAFNGAKRKIVDVPSANQIAVYADSAAAVGTAAAPTSDPAISIQRIPTLHLAVLGSDLGNFNAY